MNIEIIDKIFYDYLIIKDSLRITRRTVDRNIYNVHNRTEFFGMKIDEAKNKIDSAEQELEDLIVLSLFANFERQLRDNILNKSSKLNEVVPNTLGEKLFKLACEEIEKWRIKDILDLFDYVVNINIIGNLKQVLEYRNWIAHGRNQLKLPSSKVDPKTTYELIKIFYNSIENHNAIT